MALAYCSFSFEFSNLFCSIHLLYSTKIRLHFIILHVECLLLFTIRITINKQRLARWLYAQQTAILNHLQIMMKVINTHIRFYQAQVIEKINDIKEVWKININKCKWYGILAFEFCGFKWNIFFYLFMMARRIETEKVQTKRIEMNRCCWCALDEGGRWSLACFLVPDIVWFNALILFHSLFLFSFKKIRFSYLNIEIRRLACCFFSSSMSIVIWIRNFKTHGILFTYFIIIIIIRVKVWIQNTQ